MAKSAVRRPKRQALRESAARRRRNNNLILMAGAAVIIGMVALVIFINIRNSLPVGEEQTFPTLGNAHIAQGSVSPVAYNSTPPTSGPHYPGLAPWAVYSEPIRYEQLIHNMEDGGVVIYYQCEDGCPDLLDQIRSVAAPYIDAGRHVVVVRNDPTWGVENGQPYHQDMGARIAMTAWQKLDKFNEFDADRMRAFIERYEGIDHHNG